LFNDDIIVQTHSDAKRHADSSSKSSKAWHQDFLSALFGVWTQTTIFIPKKGDVSIPVGGILIFSGSKAHAGIFCASCSLVSLSYTIIKGPHTVSETEGCTYTFLAQRLGKIKRNL
jgi:hypothetical protein